MRNLSGKRALNRQHVEQWSLKTKYESGQSALLPIDVVSFHIIYGKRPLTKISRRSKSAVTLPKVQNAFECRRAHSNQSKNRRKHGRGKKARTIRSSCQLNEIADPLEANPRRILREKADQGWD